jgi:hypothetical protein
MEIRDGVVQMLRLKKKKITYKIRGFYIQYILIYILFNKGYRKSNLLKLFSYQLNFLKKKKTMHIKFH